MLHSAALPASIHEQLRTHLLRDPGQEDLCFALWSPSRGRDRATALLGQVVLPDLGERRLHGNASFMPHYFERALGLALAAGSGLAFLHSHLGPGWQGLSRDDRVAEAQMAGPTLGATGLPLVGLTLGTDGAWSARFWERSAPREYQPAWCESVRVAGESLDITFNDALRPPPRQQRQQRRTISAWGPQVQATLARLRIGIVGAGSVGNIVAEALSRMGVAHIRVLDFDSVEVGNLDRLFHATKRDARLRRAKSGVLARALRRSATARSFEVEALEFSVVEQAGFRAVLDCDVVFSCVDRPWPRCILNFVAYAHLIPVVDGGLSIEAARDGRALRRADWRAHVAGPGRRCLACLGQYDPGDVALERDGYLDDPTYISGLPPDHRLRRGENVFGFSLGAASLEVLQFLALIMRPAGFADPGAQLYHFIPGLLEADWTAHCDPTCPYPSLVAGGDQSNVTLTAAHPAAEQARARRQASTRS